MGLHRQSTIAPQKSQLKISVRKRRESAGFQRPIDLIGCSKTISIMPLVKVIVPSFIKRDLPASNEQYDISDEALVRLGTIDPEEITELVNDKKLNNEITESRNLRKSLERKRFTYTRNPENLYNQATTAVEYQLTDFERTIADGTWHLKSFKTHYKPISSIAALVKSKTQVANRRMSRTRSTREIILSRFNSSNNAKDNENKRLISLRKNLRARGILDPRMRIDPKTQRHPIHYVKLSGLVTRSQSVSNINGNSCSNRQLIRARSRNYISPEKYTVGSLDQFCNAADGLCDAYLKGKGNDELIKYKNFFIEPQKVLATDGQKKITKVQVQNIINNIHTIDNKTKRIEQILEERCNQLTKWLES